ncbi:hypothetical protein V1477_021344 [Vespula maculifrons]|uniref:Uncharacterized protein n=1 Tax=Vespula maculifrons TaxID=7453 RepID=A0ABD2AH38_VESMC
MGDYKKCAAKSSSYSGYASVPELACIVASESSIDFQLHKPLIRLGYFKAKLESLSFATNKCECGKVAQFSIIFFTVWSLKRVEPSVQLPHEANGNADIYIACKAINLHLLTPWSA